MRRRYPIAAAILAAASLSACAAPDGEKTGSAEEDVICTVYSTNPSCKPRPPVTIPPVSDLDVITTSTTVELEFLTETGPVQAKVVIGLGEVPGATPVSQSKTDPDGTNAVHDLGFAGLEACTYYWYEIIANDNVLASGWFITGGANLLSFTTQFVGAGKEALEVDFQTDLPTPLKLHVHESKVIGADPDHDIPISDASGAGSSVTIGIASPAYDLSLTLCGESTALHVATNFWPADVTPGNPVDDEGLGYAIAPTGLDSPGFVSTNWSTDGEVQGIAHDDVGNWILSNQFYISKIPMSWPLSNSYYGPVAIIPDALFYSSPYSWNHIGDIDVSHGYIYAPLETNVAPKTNAKIAFYDVATLANVGYVTVPAAGTTECGWVAINPIDGKLYTSVSVIKDAPGYALRRFPIERDAAGAPIGLGQEEDVFLRDFDNSIVDVEHIQGGAFSPLGHLYIVSDTGDPDQGIWGFDLDVGSNTGAIRMWKSITNDSNQELEGIDFWNLDGKQVPGISGQIHVFMGQEIGDSFWMKHYAGANDVATFWE